MSTDLPAPDYGMPHGVTDADIEREFGDRDEEDEEEDRDE